MTISLGILAYHYQVTVPALEPRIKVYAMHFICSESSSFVCKQAEGTPIHELTHDNCAGAIVFNSEGSTIIDKIGLSVGVYSPVGVFLIGVSESLFSNDRC